MRDVQGKEQNGGGKGCTKKDQVSMRVGRGRAVSSFFVVVAE